FSDPSSIRTSERGYLCGHRHQFAASFDDERVDALWATMQGGENGPASRAVQTERVDLHKPVPGTNALDSRAAVLFSNAGDEVPVVTSFEGHADLVEIV